LNLEEASTRLKLSIVESKKILESLNENSTQSTKYNKLLLKESELNKVLELLNNKRVQQCAQHTMISDLFLKIDILKKQRIDEARFSKNSLKEA
jgi:hypothetical protein